MARGDDEQQNHILSYLSSEVRVRKNHPLTVGGDKGFDTIGFVEECRAFVSPQAAQNDQRRGSAVDGRITRHSGDTVSQRKRRRIEEYFG